MTQRGAAPDGTDGRLGTQISEDALRHLGEAIAHLAGDSDYIARSLAETVLAMRPVVKDRLTKQQEDFLIESGTFTAEELASASREVNKGSLQLGAAHAWLSNLLATMSFEGATSFLGWDEEAVRTAISEGRLYAIEVSGRFRFPVWQFNVGHPNKLISGLAEIIQVVTPRWDWHNIAGFMATPQSSLVAEGRKTPVAWLRDGGNVNDVIEIVEASDWT